MVFTHKGINVSDVVSKECDRQMLYGYSPSPEDFVIAAIDAVHCKLKENGIVGAARLLVDRDFMKFSADMSHLTEFICEPDALQEGHGTLVFIPDEEAYEGG